MKNMFFVISLIVVVFGFSSCEGVGDVMSVDKENEQEIVTRNAIVHCWDMVTTYSDGSKSSEPHREVFNLVSYSEENFCEVEKDTYIVRRHDEVRQYANGTVIRKPIVKTVNAYKFVYPDGSKELIPFDEIIEEWYETLNVEGEDSLLLHIYARTDNGKEGRIYEKKVARKEAYMSVRSTL